MAACAPLVISSDTDSSDEEFEMDLRQATKLSLLDYKTRVGEFSKVGWLWLAVCLFVCFSVCLLAIY